MLPRTPRPPGFPLAPGLSSVCLAFATITTCSPEPAWSNAQWHSHSLVTVTLFFPLPLPWKNLICDPSFHELLLPTERQVNLSQAPATARRPGSLASIQTLPTGKAPQLPAPPLPNQAPRFLGFAPPIAETEFFFLVISSEIES